MSKIENIDELIIKFLSGEASPEEAILLDEWKSESPDNERYYRDSEKTISLIHTYQSAKLPDTKAAWENIQPAIQQDHHIKPLYTRNFYLRIAASVAVLIGVGFVISFFLNKETYSEIAYTTGKETQNVTLADGTHATIASHSSLVVDKHFGEKNRILHLKGSAYFSVVHNEEVPFIIDAGHVFIKDIGTKFNVRSSLDTDTVYVHVDEGIVLLFDSLGSEIEIRASENALYVRSKKQIIHRTHETEKPETFHFVNSRLGDVIAKLNEAYKTNIVLKNEALRNCTITTQFEQESLEAVLGIITETLGLSYEKTSSGYIITGQSCHS